MRDRGGDEDRQGVPKAKRVRKNMTAGKLGLPKANCRLRVHGFLGGLTAAFVAFLTDRYPSCHIPAPIDLNPNNIPRQCQRAAKSGVKYGNEYIWRKSGIPQPDTAAHHDSHDQVCF